MKIPANVEAVIQHPDGKREYIYSPFPVLDRWPGVSVDSSSFKGLPPAEKLYKQAAAFLNAARSLCQVAGKKGKNLRWSEGSVCYYCLNIAMELFLKACICRSKGVIEKTHDISRLLVMYREMLPDKRFHFATSWAPSLQDIERTLKVQIGSPIDHAPDQLHRYGIDLKGKGSAGVQFFSPNHFFGYVKYLDDIWQEAWNSICSDRG